VWVKRKEFKIESETGKTSTARNEKCIFFIDGLYGL